MRSKSIADRREFLSDVGRGMVIASVGAAWRATSAIRPRLRMKTPRNCRSASGSRWSI